MLKQPRSQGRQALTRIVLVVNLLLCLMMLVIVDLAAGTDQSALLWISGSLLLVCLILLVWLLRIVRIEGTYKTNPPAFVSPARIRWLLLLLLLVTAALRFYHLGRESFWYDEVWTADWVRQSLGELWQIVNPLPYAIAHLMLQIGDSEFVLRSISALVGILTVPVVYVLGRTLYGRREGLIAATLFSVSVYAINHSQEFRYYAWQMLLSSLTLYFLLRSLRHNRWQDWLSFGFVTVLSLYNHPFAWFVLATEGLYAVSVLAWDIVLSPDVRDAIARPVRLRRLGRRLVWPAAMALAAVALYTPQWRSVLWFYNPTWVEKLETPTSLTSLSSDFSWLDVPIAYWFHGLLGELMSVGSSPFVFYALLGVFLLGLVSSRGRTVLLTLLWVLLPLPVLLVIGIWIYPRYLGYFLPLMLIVMGRGITFLADALTRRPKKQAAVMVVLTGLVALPNLVQLPAYYTEPQRDQWRELAAFVDAEHRAGDLILFNSLYLLDPLPFDWYSTAPAEDLIRQPFPEDYVLEYKVQLEDLIGLTTGYERVWLVFCRTEPEVQALILDELSSDFGLAGEWPFKGLRLLLLTARPSGSAP